MNLTGAPFSQPGECQAAPVQRDGCRVGESAQQGRS